MLPNKNNLPMFMGRLWYTSAELAGHYLVCVVCYNGIIISWIRSWILPNSLLTWLDHTTSTRRFGHNSCPTWQYRNSHILHDRSVDSIYRGVIISRFYFLRPAISTRPASFGNHNLSVVQRHACTCRCLNPNICNEHITDISIPAL